ncbi:MAG TPA: phosphotransferase [Gaiellaceae bacterium]|nr:phosphotransferase [Gaiellaceae bacterium]
MAEIQIEELDENALVGFVTAQRWYGSKSREAAHASIIETVPLLAGSPRCSVALVEVRFQPGTHETYQMLVGVRRSDERCPGQEIDRLGGWTVYEALSDPAVSRELVQLMQSGASIAGSEGTIDLRLVEGRQGLERGRLAGIPIGVEQSNSSIAFGDALILKVYRRLEAGINPELELLRFLTAHEFPNIAALRGWYAYTGRPLDATLGILQDYVANQSDGWEFALDALASDPDEFVAQARRLGEVTGTMHRVLASDSNDPNFAPDEPSVESLGLLVASVTEELERVFLQLPEGVEALESIFGRGEEVGHQLRALSRIGSPGRMIRHHGDFHLGQVLWTGEDWIVVDFEGEPARSLSERRQKRSPLRDIAGMLRSFAYASSAAPLLREVEAPFDFERRLREEFLDGYLAEVDASILPSGDRAFERLLAVFELEKAVYELRYELDNRPDWIGIPVAGIERMLGAGVP